MMNKENVVHTKTGSKWMNPYQIDWAHYAALARQAAAEGCVLLKNGRQALPLKKGERVSVFGRIQFDYNKSGTESGGLPLRYVNARTYAGEGTAADFSCNGSGFPYLKRARL